MQQLGDVAAVEDVFARQSGWVGMDVGMVLIELWAEKWLSGVNDREPPETANKFICFALTERRSPGLPRL